MKSTPIATSSRLFSWPDSRATDDGIPSEGIKADVPMPQHNSVHSVVTSKRPRTASFSAHSVKWKKLDQEEKLWGNICGECPCNKLVTAIVNIGKVGGSVVQHESCPNVKHPKAKGVARKRAFHLHLHERHLIEERREPVLDRSSTEAEGLENLAKRCKKDALAVDCHIKEESGRPTSESEDGCIKSDPGTAEEGNCSYNCGLPENMVTDGSEGVAEPGAVAMGECQMPVPSTCSFFDVSRMHGNGRSWSNDEHRTYLNDIEENFVDRLYRQEYCAFDVCGQSPPVSQAVASDPLYNYCFYAPPPIFDPQSLYPPFVSQAYTALVDDPNDCGECSDSMDLQGQEPPEFIDGGKETAEMEDGNKDEHEGSEDTEAVKVAPACDSQGWGAFPYPSPPPAFHTYQIKPWQVLAPAFDPAMRWGNLGAQESMLPRSRHGEFVGEMHMEANGAMGDIGEANPAINRHLESALRGQVRFYRDYQMPQFFQQRGQKAKRDLLDGWISHKNEKLKLELMEEEHRLEEQFQMQERRMQLEEEVDSPLNPLVPSSPQERWPPPDEAESSAVKGIDGLDKPDIS